MQQILHVPFGYKLPEQFTGIIKYPDDTTYYYREGLKHREDGPALIYTNGTQWWYQRGIIHRLDGPAVIYHDGQKRWFLEGLEYSEKDYFPSRNDISLRIPTPNPEVKVESPKDQSSTPQYIHVKKTPIEWVHITTIQSLADIPPNFTGTTSLNGIITHYKNGLIHYESDEPAIIYPNGTKEWWQMGHKHRFWAPAIIHASGTKEWWKNGFKHREKGPAIEYQDGSYEWFQYGKRHREDGPAIAHTTGYKRWYQHDLLHNANGPAVIHANGQEEYWLNGERCKQEDVKKPKPISLLEKVIGPGFWPFT